MDEAKAKPALVGHRLLHADQLATLPTRQFLRQGEISRPGLTVWYGPRESAKTLAVLDLAAEVAQHEAVVYVASEGESDLSMRLDSWKLHHQKPAGKLFFWLESLNLLDSRAVGLFIDQIASVRPALIIVDTLMGCAPGADLNASKDMSRVVAAYRMIDRRLSCAVVIVHHPGWDGGHEQGSNALGNRADAVIRQTRRGELISIKCEKMRGGPHFAPYTMRIVAAGQSVLAVRTDSVVAPSKLSDRASVILAALARAGSEGLSFSELVEQTTISKWSLDRELKSLQQLGYIAQAGRGAPWKITASGLGAISTIPTPAGSDYSQPLPAVDGSVELYSHTPSPLPAHSQPTINPIPNPLLPYIGEGVGSVVGV